MKKILLLLALVVFVSGCPTFDNTNQASVSITDVISVAPASISVIPTPPLSTGTDFTLTFQVKNNDKRKNIDVGVKVFDWGVCEPPLLGCSKTRQEEVDKVCKLSLVPGQTEIVDVKSKTPSGEKIGNLKASCPIQWRTTYQFSTESSASFNALSKDKLTQLQRAGREVEVPETQKSEGPGPLKISFEFKTDKNYITSGSPIQLIFKVRDAGEGAFSEVPEKKLSIKIPADWVPDKTVCSDYFDGAKSGNDFIFTNARKIPLISKETPELVCNLKAPDLDKSGIPQRQYFFSGLLADYTYTIDGKHVIEINP